MAIRRREIEVSEIVDRHHMEMHMGHIETHDHHPDALRGERLELGPADALSHDRELGRDFGRKIDPMVDFHSGNHQNVTTIE